MPSAQIIQLRQLLTEKFPGVRMRLEPPRVENDFWATGLPAVDQPLRGGLPKGTLTEIIGKHFGSAVLLRQWIARSALENQLVALIDGSDSLEVTQMGETILSRLLWVRCGKAGDALKAADLILRDGNLPMVLVDLKLNADKELRKIPATTWYRFQRLVEETNGVCAVFTPRQMVAPARARITLASRFCLDDMERDAGEVTGKLAMEVTDRQFAPKATHPKFSAR